MKKILIVFISCFIPLICFCGCTGEDYSIYYNLDTFKGLEVYCWEIDDGEWRCGLMPGTNRNKTDEEIAFLQNEYPCSLKEMNKILKTYSDEDRISAVVLVVDYPQKEDNSSYVYYQPSEFPEKYTHLYSELGLH